jgi:replicative DNA helicase
VESKSGTIKAIYTPNDIANYAIERVEYNVENKARTLTMGVDTIDRYVKPVLPGEVIYVLANTSHGKTSFMQFWARQTVKQLQTRDDIKEVAVYITWETIVEELGLYDLCGMTGINASSAWYGDITAPEVAQLRAVSIRRAAMPLWVIGYSLKRRRELRLTMDVVKDALEKLETEWGFKPAIVFIDYVQKITLRDPRQQIRVGIMENVDAIQDLARDCGCPVVVGSQAKREVLLRTDGFKLPDIGDGQETSRIEQDADKVLALWYPCKSEPLGSMVPVLDVPVTNDLMIMGIRKQRRAASGTVFPLRFDPAHNLFASWQGGGDEHLSGHADH